jgi:threonine dehydrogenase-like Zn-dependent dehydrogenase
MVYNKDALVYKISSDLPPAHAAFTEPLSCALHAVERGEIKFEDTVVVAGCGPIGLGMIAGAKSKNPKTVIALDMAQDKLEIAKECGADVIINIGQKDPVATVKDMTGGYGADVYLEGTGHPSAVSQGLNILRKLGTYVEYSVFGSDVSVDWSIISDDKELDVRGAHLGPECWPAAIRMLESGRLPMDRICTHQVPLADFQKGLDLVASGKESIKVSLIP